MTRAAPSPETRTVAVRRPFGRPKVFRGRPTAPLRTARLPAFPRPWMVFMCLARWAAIENFRSHLLHLNAALAISYSSFSREYLQRVHTRSGTLASNALQSKRLYPRKIERVFLCWSKAAGLGCVPHLRATRHLERSALCADRPSLRLPQALTRTARMGTGGRHAVMPAGCTGYARVARLLPSLATENTRGGRWGSHRIRHDSLQRKQTDRE